MAMTVKEATTSLGASPAAIMRHVSSGRLKLIRKLGSKEVGRKLFWRKDVEALRGALNRRPETVK